VLLSSSVVQRPKAELSQVDYAIDNELRTGSTMHVKEFEDLIDRLGDDMSRWPDAKRQAADVLLAASAEARALLREAHKLRAALSMPAVRTPAGLADRIVSAALARKIEPPDDSEHAVATTQKTPRCVD
jgi:hypothetical protein